MSRRSCSALLLTSSLLAGCAASTAPDVSSRRTPEDSAAMDRIAESYVKLVLAVGQHDPDYVDAYYGPPEWRTNPEDAEKAKRPLPEIRSAASALIDRLRTVSPGRDELERLRHEYLTRQLESVVARVDLLSGTKMTFDEESQALYDAEAPHHTAEHFQGILDQLGTIVPGDGPIPERVEAFRQEFVIPRDRLDAVFKAAIDECRRRTLAHVELPPGESFDVEYVTGKSWSAYNWYKGNFHSLIQVNTELPIFVDRAIDLACHEGYPGHHVYNALLEKHLVRGRGWPEFSVYALFSPQSLIAEGTANYGIEVAFPGDERVAFERDVLFPLAGLDPATAAKYYEVQRLLQQLNYAGNEAARRYLNGEIGADEAADWLVKYALMSPERARQRIKFFDQYRSYVINYNLGQDLVREYVERRGGTADHPEKRWDEFAKLLSSPRLPSGLR
jgi:hypothetical protein